MPRSEREFIFRFSQTRTLLTSVAMAQDSLCAATPPRLSYEQGMEVKDEG